MCGIFGVWHFDRRPVDRVRLAEATRALRHRGPDDEGYLFADTASEQTWLCGGEDTSPALHLSPWSAPAPEASTFDLAFGFRRLSILDLSPAGHQPMSNADGSLWIVYNGEIYNYLELRQELSVCGHTFRTGADTEVILNAYAEWGPACLARFNGMWAFALWDRRQARLFCARDRFGIKPFYYWWNGATFAFASEIKALFCLPGLARCPNDPLVYDYLSAGYLDHTDETLFVEIKQLLPAHILVVQDRQLQVRQYWELDPNHRRDTPADGGDYARQFYAVFEDAVRLHLRSDVAVGTCLSGGLDSSSIVCVANKLLFADRIVDPAQAGAQQKTFSSCFEDRRFDERQYIEQVLAVTRAELNYTFPDPQALIKDLPRLIWHQDEPFGSTSIYAQWCVMRRVAERGVRVLLDGQGADELLAGYHGYFDFYWGGLARQGRLRDLWHEFSAYRSLFGASPVYMLSRALRPYAPAPLLRIARRLKRGGALGLHPDFSRAFQDRHREYLAYNAAPFHGFLHAALTRISLPALLRYEDRNSMAHSIEARVPFLDYRLVEYVFSLPAEQIIKRGYTKRVLRDAMKGVLPEPIRLRTDKMGFVTPERIWLSGALRGWAREIVTSRSFRERPYLDARQVSAALDDHVAGKRDLTALAWRWINLELWLRHLQEA